MSGVTPAVAVAVVAVGNRFGTDDGVAARVVDAALPRLPFGVSVHEVDGEATRLLDAWAGADRVVVVDAARSGRAPGSVQRIVAVAPSGTGAESTRRAALGALASSTSSHGAGVADAVALGAALGRLPNTVVVLAIEGADFGPGPDLTPTVAAAVPDAVDALLDEVRLRLGAR